MKTTIEKTALLTKLRENKTKHEEEFVAAKAGFKKAMITSLEQQLANIRESPERVGTR